MTVGRQLELGVTRVHVPDMGDGVVVELVEPRTAWSFGRPVRYPAQVVVELDVGVRCARPYHELEAPLQDVVDRLLMFGACDTCGGPLTGDGCSRCSP